MPEKDFLKTISIACPSSTTAPTSIPGGTSCCKSTAVRICCHSAGVPAAFVTLSFSTWLCFTVSPLVAYEHGNLELTIENKWCSAFGGQDSCVQGRVGGGSGIDADEDEAGGVVNAWESQEGHCGGR